MTHSWSWLQHWDLRPDILVQTLKMKLTMCFQSHCIMSFGTYLSELKVDRLMSGSMCSLKRIFSGLLSLAALNRWNNTVVDPPLPIMNLQKYHSKNCRVFLHLDYIISDIPVLAIFCQFRNWWEGQRILTDSQPWCKWGSVIHPNNNTHNRWGKEDDLNRNAIIHHIFCYNCY